MNCFAGYRRSKGSSAARVAGRPRLRVNSMLSVDSVEEQLERRKGGVSQVGCIQQQPREVLSGKRGVRQVDSADVPVKMPSDAGAELEKAGCDNGKGGGRPSWRRAGSARRVHGAAKTAVAAADSTAAPSGDSDGGSLASTGRASPGSRPSPAPVSPPALSSRASTARRVRGTAATNPGTAVDAMSAAAIVPQVQAGRRSQPESKTDPSLSGQGQPLPAVLQSLPQSEPGRARSQSDQTRSASRFRGSAAAAATTTSREDAHSTITAEQHALSPPAEFDEPSAKSVRTGSKSRGPA